jgi:glucose-1-phosphate thymidylyltransferase
VRIGDGVVVKDSFIGPYTSIYHGSKIVGCRVENSVLMEGVELDNMPKVIDNSILGNNTVVKSVGQNGALGMFLGEGSRVEW